ncbi:twin-arginine translocase subunit TatC [Kitasatospora kazusensis]|uniref:Sec-independent protein translocase protein TatC n=1 Tax=Kitasatospora kazusensis TaxID=407974 RepID=A0ABN2ZQ12_9ACTN
MSKSSKPPKDPEGRMALTDHLRELRSRLVKSVLAIVLMTIVAMIYHRHIETFLMEPLPKCNTPAEIAAFQASGKKCAQVSTIGLTTPFTLTLKVALTAALVATVPVWLYQLWAFITPGLHKHERRYALGFMAGGVPLFLSGVTTAYLLLPTTVQVLISFAPGDTTPILPPENYFSIATRLVLLFGFAFEFPLLLVMLNFGGVLSGKRLLGWWRGMIMGITVFAAFASPSAEPISMLALAAPIWVLYFVAVGIALLNDRRRARRNPDDGLDDEEASHLDLSVEEVASAEAVGASAAPSAPVPVSAPVPAARHEQMDDIT